MYNPNGRFYSPPNAPMSQPPSQPAQSYDVSQDTTDFQGPEGITTVGTHMAGVGSPFAHPFDQALNQIEHDRMSHVPGSELAPFPGGPSIVAIPPYNAPCSPYPNCSANAVLRTRRPSAGHRVVKSSRVVKHTTTQSKKGDQPKRRKKEPSGLSFANDGDNEAVQGDATEEGDGKEGQEMIWACPFCVANPKAHIDCWKHVCRRFNDLIQHIKRKHTKDSNLYCSQCYEDFRTEDLAEQHFKVCNRVEPPRYDVINDEELESITDKSKFKIPLNHVERWCAIWKRICPDRPVLCSPYTTRSAYLGDLVRCYIQPSFHEAVPRILSTFGITMNGPDMSELVQSIVTIDFNQHHGVCDMVDLFNPMVGMTPARENDSNGITLQNDSVGISNHPTTASYTNQTDWGPGLSQNALVSPMMRLDHSDDNVESEYDTYVTQFDQASEDDIDYTDSLDGERWSREE